MKEVYLPALRGVLGDWVYYSCIVPAEEIAKRINFADDIHKSKDLSNLIQRELKEGRGKEIAKYLETERERFFNSLVVAVYGGKPQWLQSSITPGDGVNVDHVSEDALNSLGFLKLSGREKLFAIDGQHRLAGIKEAVKSSNVVNNDEMSVILVAHKNDKLGLIRTRRLFTTLNKKAVAVSKGEIIALDENDVMAIVSRRLIEESKLFSGSRIAVKATNNISEKDVSSITTIGNLYDLLCLIFSRIGGFGRLNDLKHSARPSDEKIDDFYNFSIDFFRLMFKEFKPLAEFSIGGNEIASVKKYRGNDGGSVLYRPLGLMLVIELISELVESGLTLSYAIKRVSRLSMMLNSEPFAGVFWDPVLKRINTKARVAVRDKLLVTLGVITDKKRIAAINKRYELLLA